MSQPFNRDAIVPAPGMPDLEMGEFWIGNPWLFTSVKRNLSAYERNHVFLNDGGERFLDISYLTGADNNGDARTVVAADVNRDGRQDLWVRQVSGGAVQLFENRLPQKHYLTVSLRGTKSNSLGVGAKIVVKAAGREQMRELYPACSFVAQQPYEVHFGLGDVSEVEQLKIYWPSGNVQELPNLPIDQHIRVTEGRQEHEIAAK